jgi:carboxyl-terminal processing protease
VRVLQGSPASRAHLAPGQVLTAADHRPLKGLPAEVAAQRITGPAGSKVTLTLAAAGDSVQLTLTRATVKDPSVTTHTIRLRGARILDVRVDRFAQDTGAKILSALATAGRHHDTGAILDLRSNTGGLVTQALTAASGLLPKGKVIVSLRSRTQGNRTYLSAGPQIAKGLRLIELTDHHTISAAEIFTAALKDNHRALTVGQRTYGKGVYQQLMPLADGGGIKLTVGEYYTPQGQNLGAGGTKEGKGITPNIQTQSPLKTALTLLTQHP